MKEIQLSQGLTAKVDDKDFDFLNQWKWYALHNRNTYYAQREARIEGRRTTIKMHRLIMNTQKGIEVDHRDHNGLNNQKFNLRNCTFSENRKNRLPYGRSKYLGVTISANGISAQIRTNGVLINFGKFKTEIEAAKVYDEAAKKYHGEFANLNFK